MTSQIAEDLSCRLHHIVVNLIGSTCVLMVVLGSGDGSVIYPIDSKCGTQSAPLRFLGRLTQFYSFAVLMFLFVKVGDFMLICPENCCESYD